MSDTSYPYHLRPVDRLPPHVLSGEQRDGIAFAIVVMCFLFACSLWASAARGESRVTIGLGYLEASGGVVDDGRFGLVDVDIDLLIRRLDLRATLSGGSGDGAFGPVDFVAYAAGLDFEVTPPTAKWEVEIGAALRKSTALLAEVAPGLRPFGSVEQWIARTSATRGNFSFGYSYAFPAPAPERTTEHDVSLRYSALVIGASWINHKNPIPDGERVLVALVYQPGVKINWPWKR